MKYECAKKNFSALCAGAKFYAVSPGGRRRCIDHPARAEAWGNYIDALCKDGEITTWQYETWGYPWGGKRKLKEVLSHG